MCIANDITMRIHNVALSFGHIEAQISIRELLRRLLRRPPMVGVAVTAHTGD